MIVIMAETNRLAAFLRSLFWVMAALSALAVAPCAAQSIVIETITDDLNYPHAIVFLPNGDALISEKTGQIAIVRDGRLLEQTVANVPEVYVSLLTGFMDIVVDPSFVENSQVFYSYAIAEGEPWSLIIAKAKLEDSALQNPQIIFKITPAAPGENLWGGYITFLPDGTLLVPVADGGDTRAQAQRLDTLLGTVLRIDKDGNVPPDNPFTSTPGQRPEIFTYGHRHIIGIVYDPVQDIIYANENGPYGGDEINVLRPAQNYGWPIATYGMDYSGAYISPFQKYPGMQPPILYWDPSIAPSGMTQCRGCQWPEWEGNLFTGALSGLKIMRVEVQGMEVMGQEAMLEDLGHRIRDVEFGPDGALYAITDGPKGSLLKLSRGPDRNN
jgi:glucose/arabinose dehydrogenase